MTRDTTAVKIGETRTRWTVTITSEACQDELAQRHELAEIFLNLGNRPALFMTGPVNPTRIAIFHDGTRWNLVGEGEGESLG